MELADVWLKIANNAQLTPQEMDFLKMQGRETQMRNAFVAGNTSADGKLSITMPFHPIYTEKFSTAKADVTIQIPSGYNHLMILTSGQTDDAAGRSLYAQINGDTGTNYNVQATSFLTSTTYVSDSASDHLYIGYLNTSAVANESASSVAYFNNYGSSWNKSCIANTYIVSAGVISTVLSTASWENTAAITSLRIYAQAGNLVAGSIISVYGIL